MNKLLKIGLITAGALLTLFIIAVIVLVTTVDPNEYKGEIAQAVKDETGRNLSFEGDIGFTFFPRLGLEVGPMALGNAKGFQPAEMVRINKAKASIRIMPLLSGDVTIGMVVLDGLNLNLTKNAQGVTNWDDLAKTGEAKKEEEPKPAEKTAADEGKKIQSLSVEGVDITNANVVYDDQQAGKKTSLTNLNLIIGEVGDAVRFPFELSFDLKLDEPKIETRPTLTGFARFNQKDGSFEIDQLLFGILNLELSGNFFAKANQGRTAYSGELTLAEASIKKLMQEIGMEPLQTADPKALEKLSANMKFNGSDTAVSLEAMTVKLDDTTVTATGSVKNFDKPAITFAVNVDDIDADRYMPPKAESKQAQAKPAPEAKKEPEQEPDLSALKELNLDAKLTMGKIKAMNLRVTDILCELQAHKGIVTIKPFSAHLYDGNLNGQSVLNTNTKIARWTESATLQGVQAGPLLKDLTGKDHVLGTTVVNYDLKGFGLTPTNIKRSITGTASFAFTDGAISGVNVAKMLRDTWSKIKGKPTSPDEPAKTDFAELLGSAVLTNGHITNDDLLMKSPLLRVTGKGWANLPNNNTDYTATVTVVGTLKGQDGASIEDLKGLPLPIKVKGDMNAPSISLDAKAMAEALLKGTFKQGTKGVEEKLKKSILGGSKSTEESKPVIPFGDFLKKK